MMKRSSVSQQHGQPGSSSSIAYKTQLFRFTSMGWKTKLAILTGIGALGAIIGTGATGTPQGALAGSGIAIGVALFTAVVILAPSALLLVSIVFLTITVLPVFGGIYTYAASGYSDYAGGAVALFVFYMISLWVSVRWGRGKAWVSAAALSLSIITLGMLILWINPGLGLNAARLAMLGVVAVRLGIISWTYNAVALAYDKMFRKQDFDSIMDETAANPDSVAVAWKRRAYAEKQTASALATLPEGYEVFHDVSIPKTDMTLGHLIIGPTGVVMVASVTATGVIYQDKTEGLVIPGVEMNRVAWSLSLMREPLAKKLQVNPKDIMAMIVVHGSSLPERSMSFGLYGGEKLNRPLTMVKLVEPDSLASDISRGFSLWSGVKVRQVSRRAKLKLNPATLPDIAPAFSEFIRISMLGNDGEVLHSKVTEPELPQHQWKDGDPVEVVTTAGSLGSLVVTGTPFQDSNGENVIKLCGVQIDANGRAYRTNNTYVFPVSSLRKPANSR